MVYKQILLYFNNIWTWHYDTANAYSSYGQYSKNIYLGETRIVTRLLTEETNSVIEPERTYYYHTDHLGSASLVTNSNGEIYERLEYTPYGEVWVDICENTGLLYLPYKFSAKERDSETGLYYYGARYLDPKYSLWKSTDPALGEYIPISPVNEQAKQYNQNLSGMGGIFNPINANLYHYAGNNPVRYVDLDGRKMVGQPTTYSVNSSDFTKIGVIAWKNKNKEQEYTDFFNNFFNTSTKISDGKFLLSQIITLAGIGVAKGLSSFSGGLDVEKRTFKYYIDSSGFMAKSEFDVFVNSVSVTCSYKDKKGNTIQSPKIAICKNEYNAKMGNNLWENSFGYSYYNKFLTWLYDLDF